ncbi:MAG: nicotinamide riboside transporter PnuC [Clostridiales bacterium]|nr:nicotinamide riboside transporter PnuC [Clostridiales bacterium]
MHNPFRNLSKFEWSLWIASLIVVSSTFFLAGDFNILTLIASLIGVTALIFIAKGDLTGQVLTVVFSLFYAVISLQFRYYGEMITYLGMTAPIAILSVISWLKHPYRGAAEVKVHYLTRKQTLLMIILTIAVTFGFYFILAAFHTANLMISTISIATSFSASYLMLFRSPAYALAYAANDVVLITLWILATIDSLSYLPMVICFLMFFINDVYGFINWMKIRKKQALSDAVSMS